MLPLAAAEAAGRALDAATDAARPLGIFDVPSFVVGPEIFWGDDRLEDAILWHRGARGTG